MVIQKDWNLISVPILNTWTAETLGQNITGCTVISMFNASTQDFSTHIVNIPWDDFPIEDGVGYFVYTSTASIFTLPRGPVPTFSVSIYDGWNILGWVNENSTTAEALGQNITNCSVVIMFDAETQSFISHVVGIPWDNFVVRRGRGLFIYTSSNSVWQGEG